MFVYVRVCVRCGRYSFSFKKCCVMNIFLKLCCQLFVHLNEFSATALVFSQEKDLFREEYLSDPESEFLLKKAKKI